MPNLSIITINLNNAKGLSNTIQSVLSQDYKDFEYIIIDGKSVDSSCDVITKYENKINLWISEADTGIYNAMNKGIIRATGDYCLFLNSGDVLAESDTLSRIFSNDLQDDIILFRSRPEPETKNYRIFENNISSSSITFNDLFITSFNHQATLIRRELFSKYGLYEEKYRIVSDHLFIIKVLGLNNCSFRYIDQVITWYNPDGISSDISSYYESELLPAYRELIPLRIFEDYRPGYLHAINKLKKKRILWFFFRALCRFVR